MKKTISIILALILTLALAACAPSAETGQKEDPSGARKSSFTASAENSAANGGSSGILSESSSGGDENSESAGGGTTTEPEPPVVEGSEGLEIREYDDDTMIITGAGSFTGDDLVIPSHADGKPVVKIDEDAFCETQIVSLTVPWTVRWISEDAFEGCEKLTSVTLFEGIVSIGEGAFSGCKELKSLTVPSTVEYIDRSAFIECLSLKEVTFTGGTSVGRYAFAGCRSLKNVVFSGRSDTPYSIASEAFSNASGLESVTFSEGLTEIGNYCFEYCSGLKTLYLPKSLTSVGPSAFYGIHLEKVFYAGSEDDWKEISVGSDNDALKNAEIVFNCAG